MKICVFTHTFPRYPLDVAAPFMDGVAMGQETAGNEVHVLTPYTKTFKRSEKDQKYKIHTYKYMPFDSWHKLGYSETLTNDMQLKFVMYLLSPFMFLFGGIALFKLIRREKIDIVNAHWILPNGFIACMVSKLTGTPVISTLPGSDVYMANKNDLYRWMAQFSTNNSSAVTSNSPQLLEDLASIAEKNKKKRNKLMQKFSPIIYGTYPEKFKPDNSWNSKLRKKFNISKSDLVVVGVGRLVAKKGFNYLVSAAPKILKKVPNTKFLIIGEGDARNELESLAKKLNISDKFMFPGWVNYKDLVHYYNLADAFILPSVRDEEGNLDDQSVSVIEAMSCGKAVVTSDFPGYRIVIENNKNGFLVPEKDSTAIAKALIRLLTSKATRAKFGNESRSRVMKYFSWTAIGKEYSELFTKILKFNKERYSSVVGKITYSPDRKIKAHQIAALIKREIKDTRTMKSLDIGCSTGVMTKVLSESFNQTIGIDYDEEAIAEAKKLESRKLKFEVANGEKLPFKNKTFDIVIANQVYSATDDLNLLMSEIRRVLKVGGVCYFSGRNKFAIIERQYDLPFLSWLPKSIGSLYVKLSGKGNIYYGNYMTHDKIEKSFKGFTINDMTLRIIKNPYDYGFQNIEASSVLTKIPESILKILTPIIPNYIWLLYKK